MEVAISQSAPRARAARPPHGGTLRSGLQTGMFSGLVVSGGWIWVMPGDAPVVFLHIGAGVALTALLSVWLTRHVPKGLDHSERSAFTTSSWALLASWLVLVITGLAMSVPACLWLSGIVWFPDAGFTHALSSVHLWISAVASGGLVLHLGLRHWAKRS